MKSFLVLIVAVAFLPAAGCVAEPAFDVSANHPAHAEAESAPPRPAITALDPHTGAHAAPLATAAHPGHAHHEEHAAAAPAKEKQPPAPYPLDTCVVSDEKLGEHGQPYVFQHEGREIRLCCKICLKDFQKEPAKYLKKLDESAKKKQPSAAAPAHEHKH